MMIILNHFWDNIPIKEIQIPLFRYVLMFFAFDFIFYYCICDYVLGRSIGKIILKFKIIGFENSNRTKFLLQILMRNISRFIPFDVISIFFNNSYQPWHDLITRTKVVFK